MPKSLILLSFFSFLISPAHASEIATQSGQITATVPSAPTTDKNLPPTPPILIRPTNDSATANPHPELVWTPSTDPDGNTIFYDLYLNGIATYLGISNTGNSAGSNYTSTIVDNEIRLIPTDDLSDGEYTWLVRAYDPTGDYNNSTTWNFTIDTTPPEFIITNIDIHHNLYLNSNDPTSVPTNTNFKVSGPKDIYFTIETEPNTTIQLSFYNSDGNFVAQTSDTTSFTNTTLYPYLHLEPGIYSVQAIAIDHVLLTSTLPTFKLIVTQPTLTIPIPGLPPTTILIPPTLIDLPATLTHLPATVSKISTRSSFAIIIFILLALAIYLLLILLKKKRHNLILLNPRGTPLKHATIYHSIPNKIFQTHSLTPSDHGKLYIPHLAHYSTLTIRTKTNLTILSISRYHSPLTLIIS